jgi:exonuclease III
MRKSHIVILAGLLLISNFCLGQEAPKATQTEQVRIGSWNIEHFMKMFDQDRMPLRAQEQSELWRDEEDQYEVARVIKDTSFAPDILVIEECCDEAMLKLFNRKWLPGIYPYIKVFTSNTDGQFLGIMAKAGFEPQQVKEYYLDKDPLQDKRITNDKEELNSSEGENRLFCRGPGFVLFKTSKGNQVWVGTTHSKSKSGNSKAVTEWRIRELERTRQICGELIKAGPSKRLVLLGDFNDDFGMDNYEKGLGIDAVETMLKGTLPEEKLVCLDEAIWKSDPTAASYHCEIKPKRFRSFLDHAFASPELAASVKSTVLIQESIAYVASDHLPILCIFDLPSR